MIFRNGNDFVELKRSECSSDLDYYKRLYVILTNKTDNTKPTPVNKILSAMCIE